MCNQHLRRPRESSLNFPVHLLRAVLPGQSFSGSFSKALLVCSGLVENRVGLGPLQQPTPWVVMIGSWKIRIPGHVSTSKMGCKSEFSLSRLNTALCLPFCLCPVFPPPFLGLNPYCFSALVRMTFFVVFTLVSIKTHFLRAVPAYLFLDGLAADR